MVAPRFYANIADREGQIVALPEEEAAHLSRVLRLTAGAAIRVFNGRGREFDATVESIARNRVEVRLGSTCPAAPEPRVATTLVQAVLKGDKMDEVVRDAVMMGVAAVRPIVSARSEVTLASLARGHRRERWDRIAVAAAKQSGRATVPPILEPRLFPDLVGPNADVRLPQPALMFVEPSASASPMTLADLSEPPPREATIVIGPEGGWADEETARGGAACRLVALGGRTLRADAMAVVALAALFAIWKEY